MKKITQGIGELLNEDLYAINPDSTVLATKPKRKINQSEMVEMNKMT